MMLRQMESLLDNTDKWMGKCCMFIKPISRIRENITIPGDKSISHRAIMLSSIAEGESNIFNFLMAEDCLNTIECFRQMGVSIDITDEKVNVKGVGLRGLKKPSKRLHVGNSGTTIRLISGILAGQNFQCEITGDKSIEKRPMKRIISPLKEMGADIESIEVDGFAPLKIQGKRLKAINYKMPVASAQVKSAIILASLYAEGETVIEEIQKSRDHTERMLNYLGADIREDGLKVYSKPIIRLQGKDIYIPSDLSSAAFFICLGLIAKDAEILVKDIGLNPTRTGIIDVLLKMGANLEITNERTLNGEIIGDIKVRSSKLKGINISGDIIPRLIDEIPVIAVVAALAEGKTIISNAEELKVKESNRIKAIVTELKKIGANIEETEDGMIIYGKSALAGGIVESYDDHRIAMALSIAGMVSNEGVQINGAECVNISFPKFYDIINRMVENDR